MTFVCLRLFEAIDASKPEAPEQTNVVDLMTALKKSLGQAPEQ
jgi:non-homologous end joining protein Ku